VPTTDLDQLLHRLAGGDPAAAVSLADAARSSDDPTVLVAAALVTSGGAELVERARHIARSPRDRQLVAIADAHLRGDDDLVDALAREHLVDHPDSVLVARIAAANKQTSTQNKETS
jgi:hypothetical protein